MADWPDIVKREGPAVWRTACRILGNRDDAEECVQEAFADAVQISARQPVENWCGLMRRLTVARAIDRIRQQRRRPVDRRQFDRLPATDPDPSQQGEDQELLGRLRELLPTLRSAQERAFILHVVEGWTCEQVGERLSLSAGAVGMLVVRARTRLRELLEEGAAKR